MKKTVMTKSQLQEANDMTVLHELEVFSQRAADSDGRHGFTKKQRRIVTALLVEFGYGRPTDDDKEIIHCGKADNVAPAYQIALRVRQLLAIPGVAWVNVYYSKVKSK